MENKDREIWLSFTILKKLVFLGIYGYVYFLS